MGVFQTNQVAETLKKSDEFFYTEINLKSLGFERMEKKEAGTKHPKKMPEISEKSEI